MADYHPLIARAVAGLDKNTGDARRALYERARAALVAQLRGVTPALNESDITRERLALEEAIRKVEAESARRTWVEPMRSESLTKLRSAEPHRWEEPPAAGTRASAPRSAASSRTATPGSLAEARSNDPVFDRPLPSEGREPARTRFSTGQRSLLDSGLKDFRDVVSEAGDLGEAPAHTAKPSRENLAPTPGVRDLDTAHSQWTSGPDHPQQLENFSEPMLEPSFGVDESRPAAGAHAPQSPAIDRAERPARSYRNLIKIGVAAVIVIAFAALLYSQRSNVMALYRLFTTPTTEVAKDAPQPAGRGKIPDRIEQGVQGDQSRPGVATPGAQPGAAVAQRVVLYEEDPADPQGKRLVGSAIWRTEMVAPGPGQPPEMVIRADVEIPERKLAMTWSLRRNNDKTLPASHTVEIMFRLPPDFPSGGISNVPGILMKQTEQTRGVPLAGLAVKVTNGFFLIGLSAVDADRERNIQLLKERSWFDVPLVYNNNRRAILAMEKGTPGERAFADAFRAWGQ